jgi:hypothetical protein
VWAPFGTKERSTIMAKMTVAGGFLVSVAMALSGCNIENCEQGAVCEHDDDQPPAVGGKSSVSSQSESQQCLNYCDRLSICGAPQAKDFDACVKDCKVRFARLPEQTAELCACISSSRCDDAIEGRCSTSSGAGGSSGGSAAGGSSSKGGAPSSGGSSGTVGSHALGGSQGSGGSQASGGSSSGGAQASGGSPGSGGTSGSGGSPIDAGASCGAAAGTTGGSDGGLAGAGGDTSGVACTCDCQCQSPQTCVNGSCAG